MKTPTFVARASLTLLVLFSPSLVFAQTQDLGVSLRRALFSGDDAQVASLATSKEVVNAAGTDGLTPLMIAAGLGRTKAVKALLAAGAAVDARTKTDKLSALIFAADLGHLEAAQALVEGRASVKAADKDGYTAIDYAIIANAGDTKVDRDRTVAVAKFLQGKGASLRKDPGPGGADVGSTMGNLFAIGGQADVKKLLERARVASK